MLTEYLATAKRETQVFGLGSHLLINKMSIFPLEILSSFQWTQNKKTVGTQGLLATPVQCLAPSIQLFFFLHLFHVIHRVTI